MTVFGIIYFVLTFALGWQSIVVCNLSNNIPFTSLLYVLEFESTVMKVRPVLALKASGLPIYVTDFGIKTLVSNVQLLNTLLPIVVSAPFIGNIMEVRPIQLLNILSLRTKTKSGIVIVVNN